jgi:hypothetical protein
MTGALGFGGAPRGGSLSPGELADLRPHLVNLTEGRLSTDGDARTTVQDLDAIFELHLPRFLEGRPGPVPVVFWAHGGLVGEASGLRIAHQQAQWWRENGVFPIFFAWEAGLFDALRQLLPSWAPGARGFIEDIQNEAVERAARLLGGDKLWSAMKRSAELASRPEGGALLVAERLRAFCAARPGAVTLHAVGHSAGSIFHSHFLPAVWAEEGAPAFSTVSFLAPAIRVDEFETRLAAGRDPRLGTFSVFTMKREFERKDTCAFGGVTFYRDSLLYLIREALEAESGAPILGLEDSIQAHDGLRDLFGLRGGEAQADLVLSVTPSGPAGSRSTSTSHGGFDNDGPTMASLVRRITGADAVVEFPRRYQDLPDETPGAREALSWSAPRVSPAPATVVPIGTTSRLKALCVGIDAYPDADDVLRGAVSDATAWAEGLSALGFSVDTLLDGQATRAAVMERLTSLVLDSSPGDVLVFQYAGHGTEVDDVDGDEAATGNLCDEALCPVDFRAADSDVILDDDLFELFARLPHGVELTSFFDCCHSGDVTRKAVLGRAAALRALSAPDRERVRYAEPTAELMLKNRARLAASPVIPVRDRAAMRWVAFGACLDGQLAYESGGSGRFTSVAVPHLREHAFRSSNAEFQTRLIRAFAGVERQTPNLDCAPADLRLPLLGVGPGRPARTGSGTSPLADTRASRGSSGRAGAAAVSGLLRAAADVLDAW